MIQHKVSKPALKLSRGSRKAHLHDSTQRGRVVKDLNVFPKLGILL